MLVESCKREHHIKSSIHFLANRTMGEVKTKCSVRVRARYGEKGSTHDITISGTRLVC